MLLNLVVIMKEVGCLVGRSFQPVIVADCYLTAIRYSTDLTAPGLLSGSEKVLTFLKPLFVRNLFMNWFPAHESISIYEALEISVASFKLFSQTPAPASLQPTLLLQANVENDTPLTYGIKATHDTIWQSISAKTQTPCLNFERTRSGIDTFLSDNGLQNPLSISG